MPQQQTNTVLKVGELIDRAWQTTKANILFLIGVVLLVFVITTIPSIAAEITENRFLEMFWNVLGVILSLWLSLGVIKILLDLVHNKKSEIKDLFSQGHLLPNFLLASILYNLIVLAGLILLIVPGVIWAIKFQFFTYFIVEENMKPVESLKASSQITYGDKWNLFLLGIMIIVLVFVGLLLFVVGLLVAYPLTLLIMAHAYTELRSAKFKKKQQRPEPEFETKEY